MVERVTLDVGRALAEVDATPAAKWRSRWKRILAALARGERGADPWADEMLEKAEKRSASARGSAAARWGVAGCERNANGMRTECERSANASQDAPQPPIKARECAASAGTNSQKATLSSLSSFRPLPPPSSLPAAAGAGGSAAPTAAGGKKADVGTLEGSPYAGMESAIRRSPLSVGRFLQVATAGCLRREQAEEWVLANEAGNWTTTSASGIERRMTENEAARRLASFCTSVRRSAGKKGGGRAANYLPPDDANAEKFRRLS